MAAHNPTVPEWAERERLNDMAWIGENMHVFWPVAQERYREFGRGAIVVDTTEQPVRGGGHPFAYCDLRQITDSAYADAQRMVQDYEPQKEMVILLLKRQMRLSVYRIQQRQSAAERSRGRGR